MPTENINRIVPQLDPKVPLESLVSENMLDVYAAYEAGDEGSLLLKPKQAVAA